MDETVVVNARPNPLGDHAGTGSWPRLAHEFAFNPAANRLGPAPPRFGRKVGDAAGGVFALDHHRFNFLAGIGHSRES